MTKLTPMDRIRRHLPTGCELPARFDDFVQALPSMDIDVDWTSLTRYELKRSAEKDTVPFLHLPDGALVALWYFTSPPAVVLIGAHGEQQVLALTFDDFLRGINNRHSGIPDIDDAFEDGDLEFTVPGVEGEPSREGLPELQKQLKSWFKQHSALQQPLEGAEMEALRQRVFLIGETMIRDGLSKVDTLSSGWWSVTVQIERNGYDLSLTYQDYGQWYPVPEQYGLGEVVQTLLQYVKHKKRTEYTLSISSPGIVSIDRDKELVLVAPGLGL